MAKAIYSKQRLTGAGAILGMCQPQDAETVQLTSVTVKFSAAPATAEALTFTLLSDVAATYDTLLYSVEPVGVTSIVWFPDGEVYLGPGETLKITYANTDARTYGATVRFKAVQQ